MSSNAEARQGEVDHALTGLGTVPATLSDELFAIADALEGSAQLRRALTAPALPVADRRSVAKQLFSSRVSDAAITVLDEALGQNWRASNAFVGAVDRQGVRALLLVAQQAGRVDEVDETLFRFGRIVDADHALRAALADRNSPLEARQSLVTSLLEG
jgi:F-type H+-transporting ATPase subunit delta